MVDSKFTYVDNEYALAKAVAQWKDSKEIAVDVECENNLHHYGVKLSLIQISTPSQNWIVDALKIKDLKPLADVFEDKSIQKIFHDVSFDLRIIHSMLSCKVRNIFDTQLAAVFIGKNDLGLGSLLHDYFGVEKKHKFQKADWTKRPISDEMLSYAVNDTIYLIRLRDILKNELEIKGRLSWVEQEYLELEKKELKQAESSFFDMKGVKLLSRKERAILFRLYNLREKIAESVDRPVYFIVNNKQLIEICKNSSSSISISFWENMRGVHPVVRARAIDFSDAVNQGSREELSIPFVRKKRYTPEQADKVYDLLQKRDTVSEKYGIHKHLVLSQDQIQNVVLSGNTSSLRKWQKELLGI